MAFLSRVWLAVLILHKSRTICGLICALAYRSGRVPKRAVCTSRALVTRSRIRLLFSANLADTCSLKLTGVASTCRSIRSSNGPDSLLKYFCTMPGRQIHSFSSDYNSRKGVAALPFYSYLKGWTCEQLGKMVGVHGSTVSDWEHSLAIPKPSPYQ